MIEMDHESVSLSLDAAGWRPHRHFVDKHSSLEIALWVLFD